MVFFMVLTLEPTGSLVCDGLYERWQQEKGGAHRKREKPGGVKTEKGGAHRKREKPGGVNINKLQCW